MIDRYLTENNTLAQPSNLTEDFQDSTSLGEQNITSSVESPVSGWLDYMCSLYLIFAGKVFSSGTNASHLRVLEYNIWGMPSMLAVTGVNKSVRSLSSTLESHLLQNQNHSCHLHYPWRFQDQDNLDFFRFSAFAKLLNQSADKYDLIINY